MSAMYTVRLRPEATGRGSVARRDRRDGGGSVHFPDPAAASVPMRVSGVLVSPAREVLPVVKLRVRAGESIQEAVRRFRKLCERSGLRKEMRRKAYYEKPSERRRREELKRLRKALRQAFEDPE